MLYYKFQNYEEFKEIFGLNYHSNGTKSRKNKILLSFIKNKALLHEAVKSGNYELAMYIWSILKAQMTVIMSWGIDPGQAKVIECGMEIHVQGFVHTGFVQITLNEGTDLFEITLLSEERELVKFIDSIYLDCLINTLDENIEKCENYKQRVSEYLKETQIS